AAEKEDEIYSTVSIRKKAGPSHSDLPRPDDSAEPSPELGSKVKTTGQAKERLLWISLCVLLLAAAIAIGVLYVPGQISRKGNNTENEIIKQLQMEKTNLSSSLQEKDEIIKQLHTNLSSSIQGKDEIIKQFQTEKTNLSSSIQEREKLIQQLQAEKDKQTCNPQSSSASDACCAESWKYFSGSCYYFSTDKKTWTESRDACVAAGGDLVIISSTEEQDFLKRSYGGSGEQRYWVGLTDAVKEGDWRWLDGTRLSETPKGISTMADREPDHIKGEGYQQLRYYQMREREKLIQQLQTEKDKQTCDPQSPCVGDACCAGGWKYFSGSCYYFSTDNKTWAESRDACVAAGGDLVIINSTEEQDFLKRSYPGSGIQRYWVGLTDAVKEGDWRWLDGTRLSETKYWNRKEPDNWKGERNQYPEGEDCAEMLLYTYYYLQDGFCDVKKKKEKDISTMADRETDDVNAHKSEREGYQQLRYYQMRGETWLLKLKLIILAVLCVLLGAFLVAFKVQGQYFTLSETTTELLSGLRPNESRFYLSTCDRRDRLWRCPGECYAVCNIIQHDWFGGGSVMVWGGIFLDRRTDLYRLDNGTLTAIRYQDEILGPVVRPYAGAVGPGFLLVHNNARPHVVRVCRQFLELEGIDTIDWPTDSPDLNPIEHLWDIMFRSIRRHRVALQTVQELRDALVQIWEEIPQDTIHQKDVPIKQLPIEMKKLDSAPCVGDACCAEGWKYFSGRCYYFSTDKKTWTESRDACVAAGGDLVIIRSTEEQEFLKSSYGGSGEQRYWVGLTDAVNEGEWRWLDGTPLSLEGKENVTYSTLKFPTQAAAKKKDVTNSSVSDPKKAGHARPDVSADSSPEPGSKVVMAGWGKERLLWISLCTLLFAVALVVGVLYITGQNSHEENNTEKDKIIKQLQMEKTKLNSSLQGKDEIIQQKDESIQQLRTDLTSSNQAPCVGDACCAMGWKYFSGSCYYFSTEKKTWTESRDACVAGGGHLVIIRSTEEQDFLKRSYPGPGEQRYWVGLTDAVTEGDWRWLDGTRLSETPKKLPCWTLQSNQLIFNNASPYQYPTTTLLASDLKWSSVPVTDPATSPSICGGRVSAFLTLAMSLSTEHLLGTPGEGYQQLRYYQMREKDEIIQQLEREKTNLTSSIQAPCASDACCAEGWKYFSGSCYYFSTDEKTWTESRDACVAAGGHLVIINRTEEQEFLKESYGGSGEQRYWVGLTDAVKEGDWCWLDGTRLSETPKYWYGNEPDDWKGERNQYPEGENCAEMILGTS
ncbi:hypothetical protein NFI96_020584, partial [Prochilodus magdalenae]